MKLNRWIVVPAAGLAAVIIGVAAVEAAPSPAPTASKNYAQVFADKLAGILGLTPAQTQDALKKAQLATVDQMLADGKITKLQADAMKARINAGQGLNAIGGFGRHGGGFKADRALMQSLTTAQLNAAASTLGMKPADVQSALRSGTSLSQLETKQNVSDSAVQAAMKNAAKGVLDNAVKAGTITQAQADAILSKAGSGLKSSQKEAPEAAETPEAGETAPAAPAAPGGQAPSTPAPTPTPSQSQSPAAYYSF